MHGFSTLPAARWQYFEAWAPSEWVDVSMIERIFTKICLSSETRPADHCNMTCPSVHSARLNSLKQGLSTPSSCSSSCKRTSSSAVPSSIAALSACTEKIEYSNQTCHRSNAGWIQKSPAAPLPSAFLAAQLAGQQQLPLVASALPSRMPSQNPLNS